MKKIILFIACVSLLLVLTVCGRRNDQDRQGYEIILAGGFLSETEIRNLEKTAKVWGYVKYRHPVFIKGEKCWDAELIALLPTVFNADEDEINNILYEWVRGLGDIEQNITLSELRSYLDRLRLYGRLEETPQFKMLLQIYNDGVIPDAQTITDIRRDLYNLIGLLDRRHQFAILDWVADSDYLGVNLSNLLLSLDEVHLLNRRNAPVSFNLIGMPDFLGRQSLHPGMDFEDARYRLLGLFRLWNAMKYFFPYLDIIDGNWHELLPVYIPLMLEGTDRASYELTIAMLSAHLQDAHVWFTPRTCISAYTCILIS